MDNTSSSDDSDDDIGGHYWHFHPRPSPATHHPPDTNTLQTSEIFSITTNSVGHPMYGTRLMINWLFNYWNDFRIRNRRRCLKSKSILNMISDQSVYGYLPIQEQRKVLTCPRLLPNNSHQVLDLDIESNNFDDSSN